MLCPPLQSQGEPPSPCLLPLRAFPLNNAMANYNQLRFRRQVVKRLFTTWQEVGHCLSSQKRFFCNAIFRGKRGQAAPFVLGRRLPPRPSLPLPVVRAHFFSPKTDGLFLGRERTAVLTSLNPPKNTYFTAICPDPPKSEWISLRWLFPLPSPNYAPM